MNAVNTRNSGLAVGLLIVSLGSLATWTVSRGRSSDDARPPDSTPRRDYPRNEHFHKWVKTAFVPGRTRYQEVVAILGKPQNLDRPARDREIVITYDLALDLGIPQRCIGRNQFVMFYFDRWGVLTGTGAVPALIICGFCPHVYSDDGACRLEGKLLAGCVGARREGTDTLLLPRARERSGRVRVQLRNLAPEMEFIDQVLLGDVPLAAGQELDLGVDGQPFAWTPINEVVVGQRGVPTIRLSAGSGDRVLVLEVRNNHDFEAAMRDSLLGETGQAVEANLTVRFDDGSSVEVPPVGTKFLRRIVVPTPASAANVRLDPPGSYWQVRRLWTGSGTPAARVTSWRPVETATGVDPRAAELLREPDGRLLRLGPAESVEISFSAPDDGLQRGYLLRMTGYYDLLATAK
jgi:hypothetical protein